MVLITWLGQNCAMVRGRLHEEPMADVKYIVGDKPANHLPPAVRLCAWCNAPPPADHDGWHEFCTWGGCPFKS